MIAETMVGNGDGALDYYLRINPSAREAISEVHRCEPYVYAQMIAGQDAPTHGEAKNSLADRDGGLELRGHRAVDPRASGPSSTACGSTRALPAAWDGFTVTRRFRGATYRIAVHKTPGTSGRVTRLRVDGRTWTATSSPLPAGPGVEIAVEAFVEALVEATR